MKDARSFDEVLRPLLRRSAGYARALLGERYLAEDAVQQAALRAWEQRRQYDAARPFKAWWFAILRNQCLDELRRRKRMPGMMPTDEVYLAQPADEGALDRLALATALARLPVAHREILTLRYYGDLDYEELAQLLVIPKGTVMSRLHLARKALAGQIATEEV